VTTGLGDEGASRQQRRGVDLTRTGDRNVAGLVGVGVLEGDEDELA